MTLTTFQWTSERVEAFWDAVGQSPLDRLSFGLMHADELIDYLRGYLPDDGTILDFGAGSGHLAQALLRRGYRVAAFEPSSERSSKLLALLGSHPRFLGITRPESREQFDVVIFSEVIEHLLDEDLDGVLRSLTERVRLGGILIITTPNKENLEAGLAICPDCRSMFHRWQHLRSFTQDELQARMQSYGLRTRVLGAIDFAHDVKHIEARRALTRRSKSFIEKLEGIDAQLDGSQGIAADEARALVAELRSALEGYLHYDFVPSDHIVEDRRVRVGNETTMLYIGERLGRTAS